MGGLGSKFGPTSDAGLGLLLVELVEDPALEELLVGDADLDGVVRGAPARRGHVDGVAAAWRRADAIDANLKFRKPQKQTLSQHRTMCVQTPFMKSWECDTKNNILDHWAK